MSDDLQIAKSTLAKLHRDMEKFNHLTKPSYMSVIDQMERAMEPIRRHQLETSRTMKIFGAAERIKDIIDANQHLQRVLKNAAVTSQMADNFNATHHGLIASTPFSMIFLTFRHSLRWLCAMFRYS